MSGATAWPRAVELAREVGRAQRANAVERVPLAAADGRVLASDARANVALPPFASSAMDGWAVAGDGPWQVVGGVLAGQASGNGLAPGEAVAIATGAAVPHGAMAIVRREYGSVRGGWLHTTNDVPGALPEGADIRSAGQEAAAGEVLVAAGTRLNPASIGLLAAAGHDAVEVRSRLRVAVLVLGDELLSSGLPSGGRIRDVLGPQLPMWLARAGARTARQLHVPDTAASLAGALAEVAGSEDIDAVVTTGSTAAGPADHLHPILRAAGADVAVDGVAVRPGHPMLLALLPRVTADAAADAPIPLIGLPGNPLGALAGLVTLAIPLLQSVGGQSSDEPRYLPASVDINGRGQHTLVPGRASAHDGRFEPTGWSSPHMLRGAAAASGFGVVTEEGVREGEPLQWLPLPA